MTCALEKTNRLEVTRKKPGRIWNWRLGRDRVAGKGLGRLGFTWGRWKSQSSRKPTYTVGPFASWRMTCQARDGGVMCQGCRGQTAEADVLGLETDCAAPVQHGEPDTRGGRSAWVLDTHWAWARA